MKMRKRRARLHGLTDRPPTVVEIKDKQLTATSSPFKSTIDGQEIVVTTTWERAE
jgi:hypothetical protein